MTRTPLFSRKEEERRKKKEEDLSLFFPKREFYAGKNVHASARSVFNLNLFFVEASALG